MLIRSVFVAAALLAVPAFAWAQDSAPAQAPAAAAAPAVQPESTAPAGVFIAMGFPATVHMDNHGTSDPNRVEMVPVAFRLTNLTDRPIALTSPNACQSQTWSVTDASGAVVESRSACTEQMQPVSLTVPAGTPTDKQVDIGMHVFDYNEGQTYTLKFDYYGLTAQAQFNVEFYVPAGAMAQ